MKRDCLCTTWDTYTSQVLRKEVQRQENSMSIIDEHRKVLKSQRNQTTKGQVLQKGVPGPDHVQNSQFRDPES